MTKKVFWADPYKTSLSTTVTSVSGPDITLSETIFFAFSGGQESDAGTIEDHVVSAAQKQGQEIVYTLADDHGLVTGQSVFVQIDWVRRYRLMRLHFAAELVLELFYKKLSGVSKVGAHIAQDKARIDFAWPESIAPLLPSMASDANSIIAADLEIKTAFDDEPNERRYWEISGFSRVPCGGTHVKRTGEIGTIKLKRNNKGRGNERVEIYLAS
ncbi:MAG: alanyl-tRNA editing protein [Betaproteobacteria bacterium HGW-Betaproteobacteria-16]|nr:MAG: alanyl-tRNA editing protein [Betaproteobacteria bacterium HGW-Betaproteobacteria-16]